MLTVQTDPDIGYLELTVDGRIDKAHFEQAVEAIDALLKTHRKIDVVEIVRDLGWVEPEVWWKDIVFHLTHGNFMRHAAVVSDNGLIGPLTRMFAPLYPAAIRTFRLDELEDARRWAKAHAKPGEGDGPPLDFA
jgi:hypothetical protein